MKTKEEIEELAINEYKTTLNNFTRSVSENAFIKGYEQCQQDNELDVDLGALKKEWEKRSDYIKAKNVSVDEIWNFFKPHLKGQQGDKWISVQEMLPGEGDTVIFCTETRYVSQGHFSRKIWHETYIGLEQPVTHWQQLPQPPKQD